MDKRGGEAAAKEAELTGTKPINSVLSYGDYPKENGLHLLHVPDNIWRHYLEWHLQGVEQH
ncbi:hypothetical protein [Sinobaca sp. H24]|uniref:hypothetical protein n=1 Tax=Sinobaca sp. H24 TaxID=2923376 RepID=UPI00207AE5F5|nr:hypothetical protein [Sinobaca sp. H24]